MSIDISTAKKIANLAQIEISETEIVPLARELSNILKFMEQLDDVNIKDVEPMTSVTPMDLNLRADKVEDGDKQANVLKNAPIHSEGFFAVPKVIE